MSMRTASPRVPDAMRTGAGVVALILCVGVLQGCTMKKPVVPSTDFTVSLPVADETVTLEDLATDSARSKSAYLNVGEDRVVTLDFSASFERREEVGDRLRVRPTARSFSTPIGDIALPGQDRKSVV